MAIVPAHLNVDRGPVSFRVGKVVVVLGALAVHRVRGRLRNRPVPLAGRLEPL